MKDHPNPFFEYVDDDGDWEASNAGGWICSSILILLVVALIVGVMWPK